MRFSLGIALFALSAPLGGQAATSPEDPSRALSSRAELKANADSLELLASSSRDSKLRDMYLKQAGMIRRRLDQGDLRVGDQIQFTLGNDPALNDTYTIRTGQELHLPGLPAIPLRGVLHSELESHLIESLRKFLTAPPQVRATPMVRIGVSGEVARPDFHFVAVDALLSDLLTMAGGQTPRADLEKISIRRGDELLYGPKESSVALREGLTVDDLQLIGGDAVVVGQRRTTNWYMVTQIASAVVGISLAIYGLSRR